MAAREINYGLVFVNPLLKEPIKDSRGVVTMQHMLYETAIRSLPQDEQLPMAERMQLHSISMKIVDKKHLKASELVLLKKRAITFMNTMILGIFIHEIEEALGEKDEEVTIPPGPEKP